MSHPHTTPSTASTASTASATPIALSNMSSMQTVVPCFMCQGRYNHTGIATHLRRTHKVKLPVHIISSLTEADKKIIRVWMKRHPEEELNVKMFKDKKTIVSARYFIMRQCVEPVAHDKYKRHGKMCELRKAFRMLKECNVPFRTEDEIDAMEALIELRMKE